MDGTIDFSQLKITGELTLFELIDKLQSEEASSLKSFQQENLLDSLRTGLKKQVIQPIIDSLSQYSTRVNKSLSKSFKTIEKNLEGDFLGIKDTQSSLKKTWTKNTASIKKSIDEYAARVTKSFANTKIESVQSFSISDVVRNLAPAAQPQTSPVSRKFEQEIISQFTVLNSNWVKIQSAFIQMNSNLSDIKKSINSLIKSPSKNRAGGITGGVSGDSRALSFLMSQLSVGIKEYRTAQHELFSARKGFRKGVTSQARVDKAQEQFETVRARTGKGPLLSVLENKPIPVLITGFKLRSIDMDNFRKLLSGVLGSRQRATPVTQKDTPYAPKPTFNLLAGSLAAGALASVWPKFLEGLEKQNPLQGVWTLIAKKSYETLSSIITKPLAKLGYVISKTAPPSLMKAISSLPKQIKGVISTMMNIPSAITKVVAGFKSIFSGEGFKVALNGLMKGIKSIPKLGTKGLLAGLKRVGIGALKRIPLLGSLFNFADAYMRFKQGGALNIFQGLISVGSGIANLFPVAGSFISLGLDVLNAMIDWNTRDMTKDQRDTAFLSTIKNASTAIIDWVMKKSPLSVIFTIGNALTSIANGDMQKAGEQLGDIPVIGGTLKSMLAWTPNLANKISSVTSSMMSPITKQFMPKRDPSVIRVEPVTPRITKVNDAVIRVNGTNSVLYQPKNQQMTEFHQDDTIMAYKKDDLFDKHLTNIHEQLKIAITVLKSILTINTGVLNVDQATMKLLENFKPTQPIFIPPGGSSGSTKNVSDVGGNITRDRIFDMRTSFIRDSYGMQLIS